MQCFVLLFLLFPFNPFLCSLLGSCSPILLAEMLPYFSLNFVYHLILEVVVEFHTHSHLVEFPHVHLLHSVQGHQLFFLDIATLPPNWEGEGLLIAKPDDVGLILFLHLFEGGEEGFERGKVSEGIIIVDIEFEDDVVVAGRTNPDIKGGLRVAIGPEVLAAVGDSDDPPLCVEV